MRYRSAGREIFEGKMDKPRIKIKASSRPVPDVVMFDAPTRLDLDADRVLAAAADVHLESIVILGYDTEGREYFASSLASGPEVLWLLKRLERALLSIEPEDCPSMVENPEGQVLPFQRPEN